MKSDNDVVGLAVLCFLFFAGGGIVFGLTAYSDGQMSVRKEALELNYAEYDSKTGEWQWVKPLPENDESN